MNDQNGENIVLSVCKNTIFCCHKIQWYIPLSLHRHETEFRSAILHISQLYWSQLSIWSQCSMNSPCTMMRTYSILSITINSKSARDHNHIIYIAIDCVACKERIWPYPDFGLGLWTPDSTIVWTLFLLDIWCYNLLVFTLCVVSLHSFKIFKNVRNFQTSDHHLFTTKICRSLLKIPL